MSILLPIFAGAVVGCLAATVMWSMAVNESTAILEDYLKEGHHER